MKALLTLLSISSAFSESRSVRLFKNFQNELAEFRQKCTSERSQISANSMETLFTKLVKHELERMTLIQDMIEVSLKELTSNQSNTRCDFHEQIANYALARYADHIKSNNTLKVKSQESSLFLKRSWNQILEKSQDLMEQGKQLGSEYL